jgi:hypothetical protein
VLLLLARIYSKPSFLPELKSGFKVIVYQTIIYFDEKAFQEWTKILKIADYLE